MSATRSSALQAIPIIPEAGEASAEWLQSIHEELVDALAEERRVRRVTQLLDIAATLTIIADAARIDWSDTGRLIGQPRDPAREPRRRAARKQTDDAVRHLHAAAVERDAAQREVHPPPELPGGDAVDSDDDEPLAADVVNPAAEGGGDERSRVARRIQIADEARVSEAVGREPEVVDERRDAGVAGHEAHAAELDRVVDARHHDRAEATADPVRALEQDDRPVGPPGPHGVGHERAGDAAADDGEIDALHRSLPPRRSLAHYDRAMPDLKPAIDHYDNGKVRFRGANLDGEMHGEWAFYRRDGSLMRAGVFDRGRQVGTWRTYDRSGKVVKETEFPPA